MRIYLPATLTVLAAALADDGFRKGPYTAYAVTPALRAALGTDDEEELEYAAMDAAAEESARMLAADPAAPARRVVVAAELPERVVHPDDDGTAPARVRVTGVVPLRRVASAHVDDEAAAADVAAGRTEEHELLWYATQELRYLLE
ncbi:DUF6912 family protein [Thermobifida cellulosilytica]|uniref:Uncharacterized protein n=1 Tax=Thermobifida cellulosilytica TB100 TaxID=665004 RepID=A0A147KE15_THECS|nr:hypothetical protein [Thermobifida cellulosilytica]KUP95508.1 hypothetical protein AC529_17155 [Thermobifida cellulosilytica TB100]